jgi:hypothetical protein
MRVANHANRVRYLDGHVKTAGARRGALPAHVHKKKAKGRTYYYFATGRQDSEGRRELQRLPHKDDPTFAEAVAAATLERWQRITPRFTPGEVIVHDACGDYLYFAQCGDAVKIGRTRNIEIRMANMQVQNPQLVDCLCSLTGRGHEEKEWHAMFAADLIRGEWFRWTPRLAKAIDDARRGKKPWANRNPGEQ